MRRRAVCVAGIAGLARPALALPAVGGRAAIEVLTFECRPYAIPRGPEPGMALALVAEVFRLIGVQVVFDFRPWPEAMARAAALPGAALAPAVADPAWAARLDWALPLFETPDTFATLDGPPPGTLEEARALPAIGVLAGDPLEVRLLAQGVTRLRPFADRGALVSALHAGEVSAWHGSRPEQAHALGRAGRIGRPVGATTRWLALHPQAGVPHGDLRDAMAALEADGSVAYILHGLASG